MLSRIVTLEGAWDIVFRALHAVPRPQLAPDICRHQHTSQTAITALVPGSRRGLLQVPVTALIRWTYASMKTQSG